MSPRVVPLTLVTILRFWVGEHTVAMPPIIFPVALISTTVGVDECTFAVGVVIHPLAAEEISVLVLQFSLPVLHTILPLTLENIPFGVDERPLSMSVIVFPVPLLFAGVQVDKWECCDQDVK